MFRLGATYCANALVLIGLPGSVWHGASKLAQYVHAWGRHKNGHTLARRANLLESLTQSNE